MINPMSNDLCKIHYMSQKSPVPKPSPGKLIDGQHGCATGLPEEGGVWISLWAELAFIAQRRWLDAGEIPWSSSLAPALWWTHLTGNSDIAMVSLTKFPWKNMVVIWFASTRWASTRGLLMYPDFYCWLSCVDTQYQAWLTIIGWRLVANQLEASSTIVTTNNHH